MDSGWANVIVLGAVGTAGVVATLVVGWQWKLRRRQEYLSHVREFDDRYAKWDQFRHSTDGRKSGPGEEYAVLENAISALDSLAHFLLDDGQKHLPDAEPSLKVKMKVPYERFVSLSKAKNDPTPYRNADALFLRWYPDDLY